MTTNPSFGRWREEEMETAGAFLNLSPWLGVDNMTREERADYELGIKKLRHYEQTKRREYTDLYGKEVQK